MRYVVAYDIGDDKVRLRVARLLQAHGVRVQESVFECVLDHAQVDSLTHRLAGLLHDIDDAEIRFYRLCAACLDASFAVGRDVKTPAAQRFLIV